MKRLTKIEKLDFQFPGLADQLGEWFAQGIGVREIPRLLLEKYNISISATPVAKFRCHFWVPEQEMLREKRLNALAELQAAHEQALRASLAAEVAGQVK